MLVTIDGVIIVVYLSACVVLGLLSRGKQDSAKDYFTAGGSLGSFFGIILVGLSIAATLFSGISFIAQPALAYSTGIIFLVWSAFVCMPISYVILRYWFLPRYLNAGCVYPYDILEKRFGFQTRLIASSLFIFMRIGWMAAMIYAPSIAILSMGRLNDAWFWPVVLVTGLSSTIYSAFSGIRGVIVTDAMQMVVIIIGIAATASFAIYHLPVPFDVALADLQAAGKLRVFDFSLNPTRSMTFFTIVIGVTVANLANYLGDQMSLQRYLATGSVKAAGNAFLVNAVGVVIVIMLLAGTGITLFVFYSHTNDPNLPKAVDRVFPYFVAHRLPAGLSGLLLAALLAATMSSMTSGINALAGVVTLDFRSQLKPMGDREGIVFAKTASLVIGIVSTLAAGLVSLMGKDLFDLTQVVLGVFAGPLLACMVLAVSNIRIHGKAMNIGLVAGIVAGVSAVFTPLAALWISPISTATTALVAWIATQWTTETKKVA